MIRSIARSIPILACLAAACDTADPLSVASAANAASAETLVSPNPGGGQTAVLALVSTIEEAWATKDAALYASVYAEDVDGISPVGGLTFGRAAIEAIHTFLFAGIMANSSQTVEVRRIEFLTGTNAIVDLTTAITGYTAVPPGLTPINGALVSRVRWIVQKRGPEWQVIASQITPLPF